MTPREKFIMALEGKQPPGRVPHFELVFFLTMEAFGRLHPSQRQYGQWDQMSDTERDLHRRDIADLYVQTARKYEHSAIFFHQPGGWKDTLGETCRTLGHIREQSGQDYFLMVHGDATYSIPGGDQMMDFVVRLAEEPQKVKDDAKRMVEDALASGQQYKRHGALDGMALCCDYCYNDNPISSEATMFNVASPLITQQTAHCGVSYLFADNWMFSLAYTHAFENSVSGPVQPAGSPPIPGSSVSSTVSADALSVGFSKRF